MSSQKTVDMKRIESWGEFQSLTPKEKSPYLTSPEGYMKRFIFTQQLNRANIEDLFKLGEVIRTSVDNIEFMKYIKTLLSTKSCVLYFTQCSTRTYTSFSLASQALGMMVEEIRDAELSAMYKGESEIDTLITLAELSDLIVMRQTSYSLIEQIAFELYRRGLSTRIINGGSGPDQHPTQALLELYTLFSYFDIFNSDKTFEIAFLGDLKRSRTARSLSYLLALYPQIKHIFIAPDELQMDDDILKYLDENSVKYEISNSLDEYLPRVDAIYSMRIQDEYSTTSESVRKEYQKYHLSMKKVKTMKEDSCIIHPLPRRDELPIEIDTDHRAKYWEAVYRGKIIRIALILYMFGFNDSNALRKVADEMK